MLKDSSVKNRYRQRQEEQSDQLPDQWDSVQKRLQFVEQTLIKMQKKIVRTEKRTQENEEQLLSLKKQIKKRIQQSITQYTNEMSIKERQLEVENMKQQLSQLHNFIKRIEKKNNEMFKQIKQGGSFNYQSVQEKIQQRLQQKLNSHFQSTKSYIDKTIGELNRSLNKQAKLESSSSNNFHLYKKGQQLQKSLSKSKFTTSKKEMKDSVVSHSSKNIPQYNPSSEAPLSPSNNSVGNSRVSYLRQKLKEFEQVNKKYQDKSQSRSKKSIQKNTVQKMKNFKLYLQQSQSELEQSNLEIQQKSPLQNFSKKWKANVKNRYQDP